MRRNVIVWCCLILVFIFPSRGWTGDSHALTISGAVKQPLRLTLEDLSRFQSVNVRLNEVGSANYFSGAFDYRGVPLRTLLELAHIQKEEASFRKFLDIAIVVRNAVRKQIVLSWGEVFYRNPGEIILAFEAAPIMPEMKEGRAKWADTLQRPIGFPKLVAANDFYIDRSMEAVASIEVIVLNPSLKPQKTVNPYAPSFTVSGSVRTPLLIADLSAYPHAAATIKVVGSGRGYQGLQQVNGVPLVRILEKAGARMDLDTVYLVTHSDGYRAALSFGELFLDPAGERILVADGSDNQGATKEGRFSLHLPNDLSSDRNVKGIAHIEAISLKASPKIYIIGVGCADTSLITLEALSHLNKTDAVVCSEDIAKRYAFYIGHREVLFDPFKLLVPKRVDGTPKEKISRQEREKLAAGKVAEAVKMIREALDQGKSVALLEYGDPTLYGSFRSISAGFTDHEKVYIPGISAFNAANALIGREMACKGSVILASPWSLKENPAMLKALAAQGDTLAIFMGLREIEDLVLLLKAHYPGATPVAFAIRAGYSESRRLIKTTLDQAAASIEKENEEKEPWLGMIYVGSCIN